MTQPIDDGVSQIAISEPQSLASEGQGHGGQDDNKDYNLYNAMEIKSVAVYQNYRKSAEHAVPAVQSNSETDPFMITSLLFCPLCRGAFKSFVDLNYAQKHLVLFHKIPEEHILDFPIKLHSVKLS